MSHLVKSSHWSGVPIGCSKIQRIKLLEFSCDRSDGVGGIRVKEVESVVSPFVALFEFALVTCAQRGEGTVGEEGK